MEKLKIRTGLKFKWEKGSLNDNGTRIFLENGIDFYYDVYHNLRADFCGLGVYDKVDYVRQEDGTYEIYSL